MKKYLFFILISLAACIGNQQAINDKMFLTTHNSVNINDCIQLDMINYENQTIWFSVVNKTNNKLIVNGKSTISIFVWNKTINEWEEIDNYVTNDISFFEGTTVIEPASSKYGFPGNFEVGFHPVGVNNLESKQEYRAYFEVNKVIEGCQSSTVGAFYDFNYLELEMFFNQTLQLDSKSDLDQATKIFQSNQNDKQELITIAIIHQLTNDFTKTPFLFNNKLGDINWEEIQPLMEAMGNNVIIYKLEQPFKDLSKFEFNQSLIVKKVKNDEVYVVLIEMPERYRFGILNIWIYIQDGKLCEIAFEQNPSYMFNMIYEQDEYVLFDEEIYQSMISMHDQEKNKRFALMKLNDGYLMEIPLVLSKGKRFCINEDPFLFYAFIPDSQDTSILLSIFRQNYNVEKVDRFDINEMCVYLK